MLDVLLALRDRNLQPMNQSKTLGTSCRGSGCRRELITVERAMISERDSNVNKKAMLLFAGVPQARRGQVAVARLECMHRNQEVVGPYLANRAASHIPAKDSTPLRLQISLGRGQATAPSENRLHLQVACTDPIGRNVTHPVAVAQLELPTCLSSAVRNL